MSTTIAMLTFAYAINGNYLDANKNYIFVDLFDVTTKQVQTIKSKGHTPICYLSTTLEKNRPDSKRFTKDIVGKKMSEWDEYWTDYRSSKLRKIITNRFDLGKSKGCAGYDVDNFDGHLNDTGFKLNAKDQLNFAKFLSKEARKRGMKLGLKNSAETANKLEPYFDFVVIESCFRWKECDKYSSFDIKFPIEYTPNSDEQCKKFPNLVFANKDLTKQVFCK